MKRRLLASVTAALLTIGTLTACGNDNADGGVVAATYPLEFAAKRIVGDKLDITSLAKPGAEPHDLELSPKQVAAITDADLILYLHGFQPDVDAAVKDHNRSHGMDALDVKGLDTVAGHEEADEHGHGGETDPHVWLDPVRYATIVTAIAERLAEVDSDNADTYRDNAKKLTDELAALDTEFQTGLATCATRTFITAHEAFAYLAQRYNLEQYAVSGLDPEQEPSPGRLADVADYAKSHNISVIFFEEAAGEDVAATIAEHAKARTDILSPLESVTGSDDYFSVMRDNLAALRSALNCQ